MPVRSQTVNGQDTWQTDPPQFGGILVNSGPITITEVTVASIVIPAGAVLIGKAAITLTLTATGVMTNSATQTTWTFRVRVGTTTKAGTVVAQDSFLSGTTVRTNAPCRLDGQLTIRSAGASGTAIGHLQLNAAGLIAGGTGLTAPVTLDTSGSTLVELTAIGATGAPSLTFHTATIEVM